MMYLVTIVFACITLGVVQSDGASVKESFECPSCYGAGRSVADARKKCDDQIEYEDCSWRGKMPGLICATMINSYSQYDTTVERSCEMREYYDETKVDCLNSRRECGMAMCNTTRCTAVVSDMPVERCLYCVSTTSLEDCDKNAVMMECLNPSQARCFVGKGKSSKNPNQYQYSRGCASEQQYQWYTRDCADAANNCQVGFCRESECLASLGN